LKIVSTPSYADAPQLTANDVTAAILTPPTKSWQLVGNADRGEGDAATATLEQCLSHVTSACEATASGERVVGGWLALEVDQAVGAPSDLAGSKEHSGEPCVLVLTTTAFIKIRLDLKSFSVTCSDRRDMMTSVLNVLPFPLDDSFKAEPRAQGGAVGSVGSAGSIAAAYGTASPSGGGASGTYTSFGCNSPSNGRRGGRQGGAGIVLLVRETDRDRKGLAGSIGGSIAGGIGSISSMGSGAVRGFASSIGSFSGSTPTSPGAAAAAAAAAGGEGLAGISFGEASAESGMVYLSQVPVPTGTCLKGYVLQGPSGLPVERQAEVTRIVRAQAREMASAFQAIHRRYIQGACANEGAQASSSMSTAPALRAPPLARPKVFCKEFSPRRLPSYINAPQVSK
jgi:hypothetical protein